MLEWTAAELARRSIPSARLDAEVLLAHALGTDRLALYMDLDRPLDETERGVYRALVERRRRREPVAYLTGTKEFWSLPLEVGPAVLVPRPETETLVEEALAELSGMGPRPWMVDVGTGSGCVALALASEQPLAFVVATERERGAASVARRNAAAHGLGDRVTVVVADLLDGVGGPVDLVVSNPPYIPSDDIDGLEPEVAVFEPRAALDGGADGLEAYRALLAAAPRVLRPGGRLALEVGHDEQAAALAALLVAPLTLVRVARDLGGGARVVVVERA